MDIRQEPASFQAMYGAEPGTSSFANNCLLARRLVEDEALVVWLGRCVVEVGPDGTAVARRRTVDRSKHCVLSPARCVDR